MDDMSFRGSGVAMVVDRHVGERIRERRTLLGFTQEQLADALDISYQQVQKYETGANRVSAGRLFQIAKRLDVPVAYFFDGIDAAGGDRDGQPVGSSRAIIDLVRSFQQIHDDGVRGAMLNLMKNLSGANGQDAAEPVATNGAAHPNGVANGHDEHTS